MPACSICTGTSSYLREGADIIAVTDFAGVGGAGARGGSQGVQGPGQSCPTAPTATYSGGDSSLAGVLTAVHLILTSFQSILLLHMTA